MSAPAHVFFASYGNDSVALIRTMADRGLFGVVLYSDTGWGAAEWRARVADGEAWARSLGFETARTSASMVSLVAAKKAWPRGGGGKYQFCTQALKKAPALAWLDEHDPEREATCYVGVRREESPSRAQWPEWVEESPEHGGRSLCAPLVRVRGAELRAIVARTPMPFVAGRSKECWPCVNARVPELARLEDEGVSYIAGLEGELGINGNGNPRVMFAPARFGGAVGIRAVREYASGGQVDLYPGAGCDGGWCAA